MQYIAPLLALGLLFIGGVEYMNKAAAMDVAVPFVYSLFVLLLWIALNIADIRRALETK